MSGMGKPHDFVFVKFIAAYAFQSDSVFTFVRLNLSLSIGTSAALQKVGCVLSLLAVCVPSFDDVLVPNCTEPPCSDCSHVPLPFCSFSARIDLALAIARRIFLLCFTPYESSNRFIACANSLRSFRQPLIWENRSMSAACFA